jgi:ferritin-like metal-binding protein YciE
MRRARQELAFVQTRPFIAQPEFPMELGPLSDLYVDDLKTLYCAEQQILRTLPKIIAAASDPELKEAFATHAKQTREHVAQLQRIWNELAASGSRVPSRE